jgi:predicted nucleotidyltransferase
MFSTIQIQNMVDAIVGLVKPVCVVLFGSYAKGNLQSGSDIDLLVVEKDSFGPRRSRWKEIAAIRRILRPYRGAKDILVYSRDEVELYRQSANHVVAEAFRKGKVLYEA